MKRLVASLAWACALACTEDRSRPSVPSSDPSVVVTVTGPMLPFDHPPLLGGGAGGGGLGGGGPVAGGSAGGEAAPPSAGTHRLTVRQLAKSMSVVLGGSTWNVGSTNGFDARSATLGEPDYLGVVDENLEPSPLFLKFMEDAAKDGCNRALTAEQTKAVHERVLYRAVGFTDTLASNPSGVESNLRYLKLRFHGVKVEASDTTTLAPLRTLFDDAVKGAAGSATVTAAHVREGWRAVCVALLMAPEYHLY